jgi:predicted phosphodiesterase
MRIVIVSDIHSNLAALQAVLDHAGAYDLLWNLGDTIGYGPRPNECVAEMQSRAAAMIAGNHDLACLGKIDLSDFNPEARTANLWNGEQLTPDHYQALVQLEPTARIDGRVLLAQGSPREPVWEYLLTRAQAIDNFRRFEQQVCFIGHSHVPLVFRLRANGTCDGPSSPDSGMALELQDDMRYIINPGSVGQPRNQDPRAAYAVFEPDANLITFYRVAYDIEQTQEQMRAVHLPSSLVTRLQYGI